MLAFLIRRLSLTLIVLWALTLVTFLLVYIAPGDPARTAAGPQARQEQVEQIRKLYGLDQPIWIQYVRYMGRLIRGDFGISLWYKRPVSTELKAYLIPTLELAFCAAILLIFLGIPLGILSATYRNSVLDHVVRLFALTGVSFPVFLLGLIFQLVFYRALGWFPAGGRISPFVSPPQTITGFYIIDSLLTRNWKALASALHHLSLPAITLAYGSAAVVSRMTRSCFLEVLGQEYIRTARAKGLSERIILLRHALRNALIPIVTATGLQLGSLLSGVLLVEVIFSWPGLGTYAYTSAIVLDVNAIMAITIVTALIYTGINLLVDLLYAIIDPRIQYS